MNSPFHPMVRKTLNRNVNSWEPSSACLHSVALSELADRAPHAPYESKYCFAFGNSRAKFRRATSPGDGLKRLGLRVPDGQDSAFRAAGLDLNPVGKGGSLRGVQKHSPVVLWIDRVADLSRPAATQSLRRILKSQIQMNGEHQIPAHLRLHSRGIDQQSSRPRANARCIHDTIETDRFDGHSDINCCRRSQTSTAGHHLLLNNTRSAVN